MKTFFTKNKNKLKNTLRRQFARVFGTTLLFMMLVLASVLYQQESAFLYDAKVKESKTLAATLASVSKLAILNHDSVALADIQQAFSNIPDLNRAYLLSPTGEILSSTRKEDIGLFLSDSQTQGLLKGEQNFQILMANNVQVDVATPIFANQRHIGWARIDMSMKSANDNLQTVLLWGVITICISGIFIACISIVAAEKLTKRLRELVDVFSAVTKGQRNIRASVKNNDEVSLLAESFNHMIDTLNQTEYQREQITCFYSAWIACNDVIIREKSEDILLNQLCGLISQLVGFKLVWIGKTTESGWIQNVASSHPDALYLKDIRVSSNATLPEGRGPMGRAIRKNTPIIFNDLLHEKDSQPWWEAAKAADIRASAAFPLTKNGVVIGAMALYSNQVNYFTHDLINLIRGLCEDISYALDNLDRQKIQLIQDYELRIAAAAFESQESFMVTDAQNNILRVNNGFTALMGYTLSEVLGKNPNILKSGRHSVEFYEMLWANLIKERFWEGEIWNRKKSGEIFPIWICITAISNAAGEIVSYVASSNDISQRKADEERIKQLAFYDELTKLPNRTLLFQRLNLALNSSRRYQYHGAIMFLDLDHFKTLNDTLGHTLGDQLLIEVSRRLSISVRNVDTVARLGGDEFIIILEHLDSERFTALVQAQAITEKIRAIVAEPYLLTLDDVTKSTIEYHSSCSIGFALFLGSDVKPDNLLKYADLAMYHAKKTGRNHVSVFEPEMEEALVARTALEADLRESILNGDEFELYYQAQTDATGKVLSCEALIRWNHPVRGRVNPAEFIALAEETGMIIALGDWVLRQGCETLVKWAKNPQTAHLKLALNVSSRQLAQDNFVDKVRTVIKRSGINPSCLKLEITESMVVNNVEETIVKMETLKNLGVLFSMDDFGTGYSSLSYLQKLPLDQLKIDQSFVRDLTFDNADSAIVKTIINLGENLSLNIIAEGVETQQQCLYLSGFGCALFQGYYFGRPLPLADFESAFFEKEIQIH